MVLPLELNTRTSHKPSWKSSFTSTHWHALNMKFDIPKGVCKIWPTPTNIYIYIYIYNIIYVNTICTHTILDCIHYIIYI